MLNILLVVDTKNLFNTLHKTYGNGKLDFQRYVEAAAGKDHIYHSIAYGQTADGNSVNFVTVLSKLGFICKFKQLIKTATRTFYTNSNVQMAIDVCMLLQTGKLDKVVIGSSDAELVDLVRHTRSAGVQCDIFACRVPKILRDSCNVCTDVGNELLLG